MAISKPFLHHKCITNNQLYERDRTRELEAAAIVSLDRPGVFCQ